MEQQTISVAKAGITTILNSRSAVLAAANPVYGRYDDSKSAADNIDLLPTILSRFDLIFIVRDIRNEARDTEIARHVMRVHVAASTDGGQADAAASGDIDLVTLKRYIAYARAKCAPRLTPDAAKALQAAYVEIRQAAKRTEAGARAQALASSEEHGVIPVTVRQLEAMVRITEAVAKSTLAPEATSEHVSEAMRLFRVSTLNAAASGLGLVDGASLPPAQREAVKVIEGRIGRLLPVHGTTTVARLRQQLGQGGGGGGGFREEHITLALRVMESRGEVQLFAERRSVRRLR
jgi:DNA replication licensing factor MCM5